MSAIAFLKMHGLGNDFVVIDSRVEHVLHDGEVAALIANRRTGVGCDQFIVLGASEAADARMYIYNADGSWAGACGNAARCVGRMLLKQTDSSAVTIETDTDILTARAAENGIAVDMALFR